MFEVRILRCARRKGNTIQINVRSSGTIARRCSWITEVESKAVSHNNIGEESLSSGRL